MLMPWYLWLIVGAVGVALLVELYFRRLLNRVRLVERTAERKDYPEIIPYEAPSSVLYKLFTRGVRHAWNDMNSTPGMQMFQKLKTPCMMTQTLFMGVPTLIVNNAEAAKHILADKEAKYRKPLDLSYDCDRVFARGVAVVEGEEWHHQRLVLNPFFKYKNLKSLVPLFCETTHHLIDCLEKQNYVAEKKSFDPTDWISRAALDAMGKGAFGTEFGATDHTNEEQVNNYEMVMDAIGYKLLRKFAWYRSLPLKENIETEKALTGWETHIKQLIEDKKKVVEGTDYDPKTSDMLGMLLHKKASLNDDQLRHNVGTFFMGGHETITGCTSMMLCMLQQHPEIQRKLQAEVDEVFEGRDPDFESIKKLKYMDMVYREVLRLYPPAFGAFRNIEEDDVLDGYLVKKGMFVAINAFTLHRLEEYWGPDADKFDPERWGPGKPKPLPGTYLPFSGGARSCIGVHFAELEIKVVLSLLMQRYMVVPDPTCTVPCVEEVTVALSLRPGHTLRLERRQKNEALVQ